MTHVNHSDTDFLHDLLHLLRGCLRAADLAGRVSVDPWTRSAALDSALASRREITEVATCLDEWELGRLRHPTLGGFDVRRRCAGRCPGGGSCGSQRADFDAHFIRVLLARHHAMIGRSRQEVIEGLSKRGRDIAVLAISEHSAGISAAERRLAALTQAS